MGTITRPLLRAAVWAALFAAAAVSMQPLVWNVYLFVAGLPDLPLVAVAAITWWWSSLPVMLPHLATAALLCTAGSFISLLVLHRAPGWTGHVVSAAVSGAALAAVLTHWYYDSVGGSETPADFAGLFTFFAVCSLPWMWVASAIADPRGVVAGKPLLARAIATDPEAA